MIYYETLLFFFILLTIAPIIVGFIVKNKPIRYFCWLISLPLLFLTISTINKHSSDVNKQTSIFLGSYKIDTSKSVYKFGTLAMYQRLTMTVNSNNTFEFSDTSMFPSKKGSWKFYSTEDGGFVRCSFPDRTYETLVFAGNDYWGFQHDCFRNGNNDDVIYFKKQMAR
jgi:hypothetical protein